MGGLTLTPDQQDAYDSFVAFLLDPQQSVFVIKGFAGTGKSTLVEHMLTNLSATLQTANLVSQSKIADWQVVLTATTNKAAEALANITKREVNTIHTHLNMYVKQDYRARTSELRMKRDAAVQKHQILFIDEASFVDSSLLAAIFEWTEECKIVFIGDPAQLAPINNGNKTPVFDASFKTAALTNVVRQAKGNPIISLATGFRETVNGAAWPTADMSTENIVWMPRDKFEAEILQEFCRPDWTHDASKVLAYRNATVINYNHAIRDRAQGLPTLQAGDYAICNRAMNTKKCSIKTDQTVRITNINPATEHGLDGWNVVIDDTHSAFLPASLDEKKALVKQARAKENWSLVQHIDTHWIDLRAAYACTINKSQGSTYDRVFIDLDDVRACRNMNTLARLMYVGVSRARTQVIMTGDLVESSTASAA